MLREHLYRSYLPMFFHDINHEDFVQILAALPDPPAVVRAHLLGAFGVSVSGDDPQVWRTAMWRDRGEEGAAKAVAQLIISKGGKRVLSLIRAEAAGRDITPRADDQRLVRLLFDESPEDFLSDQYALNWS